MTRKGAFFSLVVLKRVAGARENPDSLAALEAMPRKSTLGCGRCEMRVTGA
jgi:hypothetical protein